MEETGDTLDLSNRKLKKLSKPSPSESQVRNLILDSNELQRMDNIDSFTKLEKGRGRHYRVGDQKELTQYLATVCPLTGETLETEEDRKLRLILSKAQHHQQQLREQSTNVTPNPSPLSRKKIHPNRQSPRLNSSRLSNRSNKSPDRMSSSCYSTLSENTNNSFMSQSLDPSMLRQSIASRGSDTNNYVISERCLDSELVNSPLQALSKMVPVPESLMSPDYRPPNMIGGPVKGTIYRSNSPARVQLDNKPSIQKTNHSVKSPKPTRITGRTRNQLNDDFRKCGSPSPARQIRNNSALYNESNKNSSILTNKAPVSDDEAEMYDSKLQTIQMKVEERRLQKEENTIGLDKVEKAAVCIQKIWRGYYTRNKDNKVQEMFKVLQSERANQYIMKLAVDMETTKAALESERKIQMLQTEAISALWKKISALQANDTESNTLKHTSMTNLSANNAEVVRGLAQTCTMLHTQIQQLQSSMQDIVKVMTVFSQTAGLSHQLRDNGTATQTEIVAVHTPQGEAAKLFPFQKFQPQSRPSSLPLPINQRKKENSQTNLQDVNSDLRQFAGDLVEGVIKTVSETKSDCIGFDSTDITVSDTSLKNDISFDDSETQT